MKTAKIVIIACFAAFICVGAWIQLPFVIPVTMQTYVIMTSLGLLGSKNTISVLLVYILLGAVGLPVFSGFSGGVSALYGPTAGFLWGFFIGVPFYYAIKKVFPYKRYSFFAASIIYIIIYGISGALWYCFYTFEKITLSGLLSSFYVTVLPFIIPDIAKAVAADLTVKKLERVINLR